MRFFKNLSKQKQQDLEHITQIVVDYVLAPWDRDLIKILETHRNELLSDAADKVLDKLYKETRDDKKLTLLIKERRALLTRCLVDGIDLACAYYLRLYNPNELDPILWKRLEEKDSELRQYLDQRPDLLLASALSYMAQASSCVDSADEDKNYLNKAVEYYEEALELLNPETFPEEWGEACFDLANVYLTDFPKKFPGDRGILRWVFVDRAIVLLVSALLGWTRDVFPTEWAKAQLQLGVAYSNRLRGDFWDNTEQAIHYFENASKVITRANSPEDWWMLCTGLGHAYLERHEGDRAENVEKAISHLQNAVLACGSVAFREKLVKAQFFLGTAFLNRSCGERADNVEQAINYLHFALKDRTPNMDPMFWMLAQTYLGDAYTSRTLGRRSENLELAAIAYQHALQGQTLEDVPDWYLGTQYKLGDLKFAQQRWNEARIAYQTAILAMDLLYQAGGSTEARQSWLRGKYDLHAKSAYCLAQLGRFEEAVTVLENGRARALSEALAVDEVAIDLASDQDRVAFMAARQYIAELEAQARAPYENHSKFFVEDFDSLDVTTAHKILSVIKDEDEIDGVIQPDEVTLEANLREAREELDQITARILNYAPDFVQGRQAFADIARVASTLNYPLVYILTTPAGSLALIVAPDVHTVTQKYVIWMDHFGETDLNQCLYYHTESQPFYFGAIAGSEKVTTLIHVLDRIWPVLDTQLMAPVYQRLADLGHKRAMLVADGLLGLFPLSAVALDQVIFACAPSARALRLGMKNTKLRANLPQFLLAIGNPLPNPQPLAFAHVEIEGIGLMFAASAQRLLIEYQATRETVAKELPHATYLHFSCHGEWDINSALDSALSLSGDEKITLRNLLDGSLDLSAARLAVLSACQTGLTDVLRVPGEFLGLPAGFLQAGLPGVVGSLWPVNDLSTALLMIRFYEYHLRGDTKTGEGSLPPASALSKAQQWLRDVTNDELAQLFNQYRKYSSSSAIPTIANEQFAKYAQRDPDERPFTHPYYWAGFEYYGV